MPNYAIRVELRGYPTAEHYETLHALMARKGFKQTIDVAGEPVSRKPPPGAADLINAIAQSSRIDSLHASLR